MTRTLDSTRVVVPAIYDARVRHVRRAPGAASGRSFEHGVYTWLVDLDDLPRLPRPLRPFARFEARDHLGDPAHTLRHNVDTYLAVHGIDLRGGRILMLANARVLGHVFNPLSVYWCHDPDGELVCVVAEVHNTYGERHCYLLHPDENGRAETDKDFYVSPFLTVDGRYRMLLRTPGEKLAVAVTLHQGDGVALAATVAGTRRAVTPASLLRTVLHHPFVTRRTSALIRLHGIVLWLRRLPVVPRPPHAPQEGVQ
ncbi:DUF1365 domain-containing protein [Pseudonocardia sp. N23]|uniref:DUF1365 domain-containing protein n=1 Tax=Pseudonocardia sp. N23 TaxID=1987376 RepID=UPI000BFD6265|nr:DUF1365 domain-containing protein [Pseudonocardia sp. N23]GAY07908.1 hypothetical protein TOK_5326 [Pseudonocardia sp. N23]